MQVLLYCVLVWAAVLVDHTVSARGCYNVEDVKLYIVKSIIKEEQVELLQKANKSCLNETAGPKQLISGLYCNQTFDNILCWPDTKAGTVAEQSCPNYVNKFDTRGKARRECLPNGQWYVHPFFNRTWTDFSECRNKKEPPNPLKDHLPILSRLSVVGYIVSLACLFVAVCLMVRFKRLHCQRNVIHTNLFVSFILRSVICLVKEVFHTPDGRSSVVNNIVTFMTEGSTWQCKLVFSLFNYIILANYMWIFIEGLYLHNLIFISAFEKSRRFHLYILAGWLFPLLCVIPWILVRRFLEDTLCWSTHSVENKYVWIIRGPIVASIVVNFIFFINIIRVIFTKLTASHMHDKHRYRKLARSTLVLIPLFGVYYMISVVMPECMDPDVELVWLYTEGGVNSFQGFLIALLFCFLNGEVQQEVRKSWNRRCQLRRFSSSSRSTRTLSIGSTMYAKNLRAGHFAGNIGTEKKNGKTQHQVLQNGSSDSGKDAKIEEKDQTQEIRRLL